MSSKIKPLRSVLIKPSGADCNLNCRYCFYLDKSALYPGKLHRMSPQIQETLIRQVMQYATDEVSLTWQGGEPTLMGLDFYKRAIELEMRYGRNQLVGNGLQTNGLLLDRSWGRFLKEYQWLVGISLDGPAHIHDHYRLDQGGHPPHHRVEENARMLLDEGVAVNAMCCITDHSVKHPEELYAYYKELGLNVMQFIPIVETDKNNPGKAADFSVLAEDYGRFLCTLFDLWLADFRDGQPTTSIRHFESVFYRYVGLPAPECTMMRTCGQYVVVEHNGDVYGCDYFVEPRWRLGNIASGELINMLNTRKQEMFGLLKTQTGRPCRRCPWLSKCYGGCTKDRVKDPRDMNRPRFCTSYKMFLEYADPVLCELARQWKQQEQNFQQARATGGNFFLDPDALAKDNHPDETF